MSERRPFAGTSAAHVSPSPSESRAGGVWAGQESNLRPMDYESTALTAELPARGAGLRLVRLTSMVDGWSARIPFVVILGPR